MRVCIAAFVALTLVAFPASAEQATPLKFEDDASRDVRAFFDQVASSLLGATEGRDEARQALMGVAIMPRFFSDELNVFTSKVNEHGKPTEVRFTGFEVKATLWFGIIPVEKVTLFFWMGEDEIRVLKLDRKENHKMRFFETPSAPSWGGAVANGFGSLADTVLRAASSDACASVPLVRPDDLFGKKPDPRALGVIMAQADRAASHCASLSGMPYNRLTWELGAASGIATTGKKAPLGFGVDLVAGPQRGVRLYRLTRPESPR